MALGRRDTVRLPRARPEETSSALPLLPKPEHDERVREKWPGRTRRKSRVEAQATRNRGNSLAYVERGKLVLARGSWRWSRALTARKEKGEEWGGGDVKHIGAVYSVKIHIRLIPFTSFAEVCRDILSSKASSSSPPAPSGFGNFEKRAI